MRYLRPVGSPGGAPHVAGEPAIGAPYPILLPTRPSCCEVWPVAEVGGWLGVLTFTRVHNGPPFRLSVWFALELSSPAGPCSGRT